MAFKKAVKEQGKLRLALCGLAGSGKTYTALAIATTIGALMRAAGHGAGRVAVIDSERGSAQLYADKFEFDVDELDTFSPLTYVDRIHEAESAGYDIIVLDSISHAWMGRGGALEQRDIAAARAGNGFTAWSQVTPKHNALVDAMMSSRAHVIATMRVKMEHAQVVNAAGKTEIQKLGLAAVQRDGMEYEFTLVGDLDHNHSLKISKTRVHGMDIGDMFDRPGEAFTKRIYSWLMSGAAREPRPAPRPEPAETEPPIEASGELEQGSRGASYALGERVHVGDPVNPRAAALAAIAAATSVDGLKGLIPQLSQFSAGPERAEVGGAYKARLAVLETTAAILAAPSYAELERLVATPGMAQLLGHPEAGAAYKARLLHFEQQAPTAGAA